MCVMDFIFVVYLLVVLINYSLIFYYNFNYSILINHFFKRNLQLGRIEIVPSEGHIEEDSRSVAATATWMNDTGISVCSANVPTIGNQNNAALSNMLKRPSELLLDAVEYEKRIKLESNHQEDHKLVLFHLISYRI